MSYIDSSTRHDEQLNGLAALLDDDDERPDRVEKEEIDIEGEPVAQREKKPRTGTIIGNLREQLDDVNLARRLGSDELDRIGQLCLAEYNIDEQSRKDWEDMAEAAMRFTVQDSDPKQYPWPDASNVIFPLLSQAATEFGSRAYPAIIQGNRVVRGIVWGSDRGTPMKDDGGNPVSRPGQPMIGPAQAPAPGQMPGAGPQPQGAPGAPPAPQPPVWLIEPGAKRTRAEKIGEHMSWQLLVEMPEWEPQTDQLLHQLPVVGGAARKTYRNFAENKNESLFVPLMNLVWNYRAPSFETAPRHTEKLLVYPHEIVENERAHVDEYGEGLWLHYDYGPGDAGGDSRTGFIEGVGNASDEDSPHLFLEQHRRLDLDEDDYPEPYVVTVHKRSGKVVRIVARYDEDGIFADEEQDLVQRIEPDDYYSLIRFLPAIDGGSYPIGFGHLIKPLNEAINTTLNQMFDAGHLQNAGGGFIGEELGVASGQVLFQVGRYTRVKTRGQSIRESVFPMPFQGPSPVLFQLLGFLVEATKNVAGVQNVLVGDAAIANAPPTTILALIEQGLGFYTAIIKRVFRGFTAEYAKLHKLNTRHISKKIAFHLGDEEKEIGPDDYKFSGGVTTIADPRMTTDMQRLGRASLLGSFKEDPLLNQREIRIRILEAANIERIDDLMAPPDPNAAAFAQMAIDKAQAELGRERAAEQKDLTQAYLNLALARKNATAQEEAYLAAQLDYFRLRIEAINADTRAATAAHLYHDTAMESAHRNADRAQRDAEMAMEARQQALAQPAPSPQPGPTGPFPVPPSTMPGPAVNRPFPGGPPPDIAAGPGGPAPQPPPGGPPGGPGGQ